MSDVELQARLDAARASQSAAAAKREAMRQARALSDEVTRAERAARDEAAIAEAEEKYGDRMAVVQTDMGAIIVTPPNPTLFRRFQDTNSYKVADLDRLARPCVKYPELAVYDRILDELPATLKHVSDAVVTLAGLRQEALAGKA